MYKKRKIINVMGCFVASVAILVLASRAYGQSSSHLYGPAVRQAVIQRSSEYLVGDTAKRKEVLRKLLPLISKDRTKYGHVSYWDKTFRDWIRNTGELPPDFAKMSSNAFLPSPLILDEGSKNIHITTMGQWKKKRKWMRQEAQYYITGTFPPPPQNLRSKVLSKKRHGKVTIRKVKLSFGPGRKAKMVLEMFIPPGKGPFPVFMTQWNHRDWAAIAETRGYIGLIYAGCDKKDDTKNYSRIYGPQYTWSRLMRRAWGASRVVDYLYKLPKVNKHEIGITGHSRNGKQSLWAAAYDKRFDAVIISSGNSGGGLPWRYAQHKYADEDINLLTGAQPAWFNPRLRFFIGRVYKLPIDMTSLMALVAPRGLMMSSSRRESDGNPWGYEQAYDTVLTAYKFLGAPNHLALRLRDGKHGTSARDIENYVDFFNYIFGRGVKDIKKEHFYDDFLYDYSFKKWRRLSGIRINPLDYPIMHTDDLLKDSTGKTIHSVSGWERKDKKIKNTISWMLGKKPSQVPNKGPVTFGNTDMLGEDYFGSLIPIPRPTARMGRLPIAPGHNALGFGNYLYGYLYYPKKMKKKMKKGEVKLPVIIYLHKYNYVRGFWDSQGFDHNKLPFLKALVKEGYAVFFYPMMGFGNRIEEGTRFFQRHPKWSKMGKDLVDLNSAVYMLSHLNFVDSTHISVLGYSLGGMVGLYGAALNKQIASVVSVCGFTPMRTDTPDSRGDAGIKRYSYLRGLIPKLGFFVGYNSRIPYDYDGVLASIAPRPLLVISPVLDDDATFTDVKRCVKEVKKVYGLYGKSENIQIYSPYDYNRFSKIMQEKVLQWFKDEKNR